MYEPEKILVQNAGIDPGVAALLQNANKGNMDPAALMAMMNNGGFGGNGGWWWIWIILIFFCWGGFGGNGFGRGSLDQLEAQVEAPIITNTIDNSKEINDLKNDVADIRKMIEDTKKMFMGGFPKPPMPPMPNVPAPMK